MRRLAPVAVLMLVTAALAVPTPAAYAAVSDPIDPAAPMAVATWGKDRLDLFAKGTDGTLKHKIYNGRWSAWESLGGAITSGPAAASWGPGRLDVFARGLVGDVQHRSFQSGAWSDWKSLGGVITGEPAVTSWGSGRLDVFVRGTSTNQLYHRYWDGSRWQPNAWEGLQGGLTSSPTATNWGSGNLTVFVRGGNNVVYRKGYSNNTWDAWAKLTTNDTSQINSAPSVVSFGAGHFDVYALRGQAIQNRYFIFPTVLWTGWNNLDGGAMRTGPAVTSWADAHVALFVRATDGTLKRRSFTGSWGAWQTLPDATPLVPERPYTRTVAVQGAATTPAVGGIFYAYADNIGQVVLGVQPDPANASSVQWTPVSGLDAYAGQPGLVPQADGQIQLTALHRSGDVRARASTATTATAWVNQGGQMVSVSAAQLPNRSVVVLATDATGAGWFLPQSSVAGPYGIWKPLNITGLTEAPIAVPGQDGIHLFASDGAGAVRTASLSPAGVVSAWVSLGGSGLTGSPAAVVYPGHRMRVFARASDGTVVTKAQDAALAWPAAWTPVSAGPIAAGAPAAVLSPLTGRTEVVVRGTDGLVYSTGETAQGSGQWRDWTSVQPPGSTPVAATDPTAFIFNDGTGLRWAFVVRDADQRNVLFTVNTDTSALAGLAADAPPAFTARRLPDPPH